MQKNFANENKATDELSVSAAEVTNDTPIAESKKVSACHTKKYVFFFKRAFDIICSLIAILLCAIPMIVIAIAIKIESKGPAVFKSKRMGRNMKVFNCYKFRSMRTDAPADIATRLIDSDQYLTKVGRFIRKTSLDELPQFFNILFGTMSFVGPRPVVLTETDLIEERRKLGVYDVPPGLTGLAQINGRDNLDVITKANYDAEYAKKITLMGDIKIMAITIVKVFKEEDVIEGGQNSAEKK